MRKLTIFAVVPLLLVGAAGCDLLGGRKKTETKTSQAAKPASAQSKLCASNATYARLKESAFDEAKRIRERDTEQLDALADASVVRMENPLLESRDEALGLTVCSGRMVLELPPGAGAAFDGRQRLAADITYSAQAAADGSGTVFKIDGGEPIVYRLAGFDPRRTGTRTASVEGEGLDTPDAELSSDAPADEPAATAPAPRPRAPAPAPQPTRVATPRPPAPPLIDEAQLRAQARREARAAAAEQTARVERMREADRRAERIAQAQRIERGQIEEEDRPTRTARPSFNCRYARSRVEKMICGSSELAARDRQMASLYYRSNDVADARTRRQLSASRLRFLAFRDRCDSEACVADAYADRMDEIRDMAGE